MKYKFDNIVAVGAHPDDIEIGCGASLSKWYSEGLKITCIVMSCENTTRHKEIYTAFKKLGIPSSSVVIGEFEDGKIPHNKTTVSFLDKHINSQTLLISHNENDTHQDHINTSLSAMSSGRNALSFLQWTTVPFRRVNKFHNIHPSFYVCVDDYIYKKISSIECHNSQIKRFPINWKELIKQEALLKAVNSNCKYVESFYLKKFTI